MELKNFNDKINGMIPDIEQYIKYHSERLFKSGAVDVTKFDDGDYILPKLILSQVLKNVVDQYHTPYISNTYRKDISNLKYF